VFAEDVGDGVRHGDGSLAASDHKDAFEPGQIVAPIGDDERISFSTDVAPDCGCRIDRIESGLP
jgi:hypothetical protein